LTKALLSEALLAKALLAKTLLAERPAAQAETRLGELERTAFRCMSALLCIASECDY
jgi:hypothetical protein